MSIWEQIRRSRVTPRIVGEIPQEFTIGGEENSILRFEKAYYKFQKTKPIVIQKITEWSFQEKES